MNFDSGIQWTDITTNPLRFRDGSGRDVWACVKVSPGCANCYSAGIAERFKRGGKYNLNVMQGLMPYLDVAELGRILRSKRASGKRCFPFDMTDVFGSWVPDELIAACFGVFAARPDITFQILTKHPERAAKWFRFGYEETAAAHREIREEWNANLRNPDSGRIRPLDAPWPLPNVWIGVSVEDQPRADERIPHLLRVPAAVRFLSVEPMLGHVDLRQIRIPQELHAEHHDCLSGYSTDTPHGYIANRLPDPMSRGRIDWVIVGGESGPGARPFNCGWARSTVQQCKAASVPVFVKQLGSEPRTTSAKDDFPASVAWAQRDEHGWRPRLSDRKGGDMSEWPVDLRVREWPEMSR